MSTYSAENVDLVVVGGGPAAHSAAEAYRKAGGPGRVVIISADDTPPYSRPPLSKDFLRGESDETALPMEDPGFYAEHDIEVWLADPAAVLDTGQRSISTRSGRALTYRECLLATGCRPAPLTVPGADHPDILLLRSLTQARLLRGAAQRATSAVVIGSGFIGCEAAVSLAMRGVATTMIAQEELPQLTRLGRAAATRLAGWLAAAGVSFEGGTAVAEIIDGRTVVLDTGTGTRSQLTADLVLSATGVTPNAELAEAAGIPLEDGRILVDAQLATAVPGVRAAGDVVFAQNTAAGRRLKVEHWGEALRMGEIAGTNAAGGSETWDAVPGFWSSLGDHQLKYVAWGDGFDTDELVEHADGGFTVWYSRDDELVGALTYRADADYERAPDLIRERRHLDSVGRG